MAFVRGIRGATTTSKDDPVEILEATAELLQSILAANPTLNNEDLASAWFTTTPDLVSVHPAKAARQIGWNFVPLMCSQEIPVPNGLSHCIRVLLHWNTDLPQSSIKHVYLRQAVSLRPDLIAH
jgi:chorismate mutase